jgi:hypothetical protein
MPQGAEIPEEIVSLVESGAAMWMATCDGEQRPEAVRVMGARIDKARRTLIAYVPDVQSGRTFENLSANPQVGVFFCRVTDYRAVQIKGKLVAKRPSDALDLERQVRYSRDFAEACAKIGMSREVIARMTYWPSTAIEIRIGEFFLQTPGPEAGTPWR